MSVVLDREPVSFINTPVISWCDFIEPAKFKTNKEKQDGIAS